jgi:hypothetical protein
MTFDESLLAVRNTYTFELAAKDAEIRRLNKIIEKLQTVEQFKLSQIREALKVAIPVISHTWTGWSGIDVIADRIETQLQDLGRYASKEELFDIIEDVVYQSLPPTISSWRGWPGPNLIARRTRNHLLGE